jgi:hypothetical protein
MIVYVLDFDKTRIEFATEQNANEFKVANQIESEVYPFEKVEELPVWNKEAYCAQASAGHSEWYRTLISRKPDFDYESKGEIAMYLEHKDESIRNQAKSLTELWFTSVDLLYAHYDEVTEETANVEVFIQSLPTL